MLEQIIGGLLGILVGVIVVTFGFTCLWILWDFWAGVFNKWFGDGKRY